MRPLSLASLVCVCMASATAQQAPASPTLTAESIMSRVAMNQDKMESERAHYVYVQHARIASRKGKTVRCEEITDSRVTPTTSGSQIQLLKLDGRLWEKGHYITYDKLESSNEKDAARPDSDHDNNLRVTVNDKDPMDRDLVENMRANLTQTKSKDGISADLFPLTSKEQGAYAFRLLGRTSMNGRDCYHIAFVPKNPDEFTWKGDAFIDSAVFQPVVVRTAVSRKIPLAVRMLLGTDVPGLGFTIIYAAQSGGIWFPVAFGTEFKLHVLFFIRRQITFSAENRDFEKTHVSAEIRSTHPDLTTPTPR